MSLNDNSNLDLTRDGHFPHRSTINTKLCYLTLVSVAFIYYVFLITNGKFNIGDSSDLGMTFNSMLEHLLRGQFDVDPQAIRSEGFIHDGKTYSYFGIFPALLRLPLYAIDNLARYDVTRLYCTLAATLGLCFKLASVALIRDELSKSRLREITFIVLILSLVIGGSQVQFLKSMIFQETIYWAGALGAAFVYCALRGLIRTREFSTRLFAVMATLAGLELLTRVSTALGLYLAVVLLLAALAWSEANPISNGISRFGRALGCRRNLVALAILLVFASLCGVVNYERWGNPLVFADFHTQIIFVRMHFREPILTAHGEFNIERLWYGIIYYMCPIWIVIRPDGNFLFSEFELKMFDGVELPPSSFLLSDPVLLILGVAFFWRLPELRRGHLVNLWAVGALMISFSIPIFLMLTAMDMAFRYRMEFYPFMEFAGYLGFYAMCVRPDQYSAPLRHRLYCLLIAGAGCGIICSHLLLILYKLSQFGDYKLPWIMGEHPEGAAAWVRFYQSAFKTIIPIVEKKLPF
jgi:hypothetical protein